MRITRIETVHGGPMPNLVFVRIHTDDGLIGHGETYYTPRAVAAFVHEMAAPLLLGRDALAIEESWQLLYRTCAKFGATGLEMRAISALDVALWDILGQAAGMPVHRLLGGPAQPRVPVYNTCGGPSYGTGRISRPGYGSAAPVGRFDDLHLARTDAGALAADLLSEGVRAMKIWPFDEIAQRTGGRVISAAELEEGLRPVRLIREAVGDAIDVMIEGHGFWSLTAATRIAHAAEEYGPAWLEDIVLADDVEVLAELKRSTPIPLAVSEYLMTRHRYRPFLERRAVDYVMIDPTWAGGITETRKIASLADAHGRLVTMHDCTGPFTLLAGVHLAANAPNAAYQETVRAFIRVVYPELVDALPEIEDGHVLPPATPGIGAALRPDYLARADVSIQTSPAG
jgi:L-alanine-DL-glutamate epimerase-like enolase superfamily enzyme